MSRRLHLGFVLILLATAASAQVFKLEGGTSTLFNADGGTISITGPNYDTAIGAGMFQGHFQSGAVVHTKVMGYTVTAGDDSVRFDLPTDVFESTSYFSSRGFGLSKSSDESGFYAFGGLTSRWVGASFFRAARSEDPVGIFFFHHRLTNQLHFYSRNIISDKNSILQGLEWQPEKWLKTSVTGGIGSGKPYIAVAGTADVRNWSFKASYVVVNPDFRRIVVPDILNSEPERENLEATYRFNRDISITASHRNLLQPLTLNSPLSRASTNQITGNFRLGRSYFGAGLFQSAFSGRHAWGSNLYVGQKFLNFFDVSANYFASKTSGQKINSMTTGTVREIINPRLSLLQVVSYANGQASMSYGGEFVTNRFNASVSYQTVYLPFLVNHPFQQSLSFNANVHVVGPFALNASSSLTPDGRTRYSFGATTYFYRYGGLLPSWGQTHESYKFPKYVVQGIVKDETGQPVSGAAVQIGKEMVYADDEGRFLYRCHNDREMSLHIVPGQFLTAGIYEVLKAPNSAKPEKQDQAHDIEVTVRRLTVEEAAARGLLAKLTAPALEK